MQLSHFVKRRVSELLLLLASNARVVRVMIELARTTTTDTRALRFLSFSFFPLSACTSRRRFRRGPLGASFLISVGIGCILDPPGVILALLLQSRPRPPEGLRRESFQVISSQASSLRWSSLDNTYTDRCRSLYVDEYQTQRYPRAPVECWRGRRGDLRWPTLPTSSSSLVFRRSRFDPRTS